MRKSGSTYDGRLITKHLTKDARLFLGVVHLQYHNIVGDSVSKLAYDIPKRKLSTY